MVQGGAAEKSSLDHISAAPGHHQEVQEVLANLKTENSDSGSSNGSVIYSKLTVRDTISRGHTPLATKG